MNTARREGSSVERGTFSRRIADSAARGICSVAFVLLCASPSRAQTDEGELKAAFVLRVAEFVSWPSTERSGPDAELAIGVLGEVVFEAQLETLSRRASGHALRVKRLQPGEPLAGCHVLFFGVMDRDEMNSVLSQVRSHPILTLSEFDDFAQRGGIMNIRFERQEDPGARQGDIAIRFVVNVAASKRAGLEISSRLLQVATLVDE